MQDNDEFRALLSLMLTPGLGQTLVGRCVEAFGSARATLGVGGVQLGMIKGISAAKAGEFKRKIDGVVRSGAADRELEEVEAAGAALVHRGSPAYPELLKHIPDPPLLLWVRGELRRDDALALGVVGSRRCSRYGREQADRFSGQGASAGLSIVSGGAYGIDIAAHRAALRVGGRTVAVVGSGLGVPYPREHAPVFDQIVAEGRGAVVSELPMAAGPQPQNFPRRNRIISGLALGVLVVEAAQRSGALITARLCVEEHGRECMALPGRVDDPGSAGCHRIIREGWATLVTSVSEVLEQLGEAGTLLEVGRGGDAANAEPAASGLTDAQRRIVAFLDEPRSLDEVVAETGLGVGPASADLTLLEVRGVVERAGGRFVRRQRGG